MSETEMEKNPVIEAGSKDDSKSKKPRKRLKKLCQQIKEQMEFYFGDANLNKDRFLKQEIQKSSDGYIDLNIFIKFNKIQTLTSDVAVIAKALKKSELLEVSQDGKKVKRTKPLGDRKDVDERTVYVECLPSTANHEWVKTWFSQCGVIEYVSLPKYRTTGDIKGFAFVEFASKEGAEKACQLMNNPPVSEADQKPGKFPKGSKDILRMKEQLKDVTGENTELSNGKDLTSANGEKKATDSVVQQSPKKLKKRKLGPDAEVETEELVESEAKKIKTCDKTNDQAEQEVSLEKDQKSKTRKADCEDSHDNTKKTEPSGKKAKVCEVLDKSESDTDKDTKSEKKATTPSCLRKRKADLSEVDDKEAKKVRINEKVEVREHEKSKRKRKKKKKKNKEKTKDVPELRVIPKKEWLILRNEYIALQKANMKNLKESLAKIKQQEEEKQRTEDKSKAVGRQIEYTPGVIVMVTSQDPLTRKTLRDLLSCHGDIAYIDLKDGDSSGHVRCQKAEGAASIAQVQADSLNLTVLKGEAESQYWSKLLADQEAKLTNKAKKHKKRGKDKLLDKAEKLTVETHKKMHVVFDD